jgi:hypothetical protein
MTDGEKLVLTHILEKNGYVVCETQDDIDPRIITVKLWHKPIPMEDIMTYAMKTAGGYEDEKGICG